MNSFAKTFEILEYVVLQCGRPVTPSEAAEAIGLNGVTCTRIMVSLAERGYLEQLSRRTGYLPGPMIASLQTRPNLYAGIAGAAKEPLKRLSRAIGRQVNLSVLHGGERIMLVCESPVVPPWRKFRFPGEYETSATARLLASVQPPEQVADNGIPLAALKKMRREKRVEFSAEDEGEQLVIMGNLVLAEGYPPAAFGYGVAPDADLDAVRRMSNDAAAEIEKKLNPNYKTY